MFLIDHLESVAAGEDSLFRQQLLKEDVARLRKLRGLVEASASREDFMRDGACIGWTQSDMQTHKIRPAVDALLDAFYNFETGDKSQPHEDTLRAAWAAFEHERMEKLIRCL